jgi:hypothetical protein
VSLRIIHSIKIILPRLKYIITTDLVPTYKKPRDVDQHVKPTHPTENQKNARLNRQYNPVNNSTSLPHHCKP